MSLCPYIKELNSFKGDLIGLVKSIKYKNVNNCIEQQVKINLKKVSRELKKSLRKIS